jgi:type I restriction enzyme S subunit
LADIATIERDGIDPSHIPSGTLYVGLEHIESGGRFIDVAPVSNGSLTSTKFKFTHHHLLYGKLRPYLAKIATPNFGGICSTDILPILPGPRLNRTYLAHYLRQPEMVGFASARSEGANLPRLSPKALGNFVVPLPPLDEQQRIAAILEEADNIRKLRHCAIERLNALRQAVFHDMFGNRLNDKPLGQFLDFITSGGRGWAKYYSQSGDRFIRSLDVQMNNIDIEDAIFVTPPDNAEARRTRVESGDVLLTITGSRIGRVAPVPESLGTAFVSQHVAILRLDKSALLPVFLSFYLSMPGGGQYQIARAQYGQTKPGLNFDQIRAFRIPVPPLEQQRAFCLRVQEIGGVVDAMNASLALVDSLFASLRHRGFRGKL